MENQLFNLEKIKELTSSIDELQAKTQLLDESSAEFESYKLILMKSVIDEKLLYSINNLTDLMRDVNNQLENLTKDNINRFLKLQARLVEKYREVYQEQLKKIQLDQDLLKKIGLYLIENRAISKTVQKISIIPSIEIYQWLDILDSLKQNTLFLGSLKILRDYYKTINRKKLEIELSKIPKDTDISLIKDYKVAFLEDSSLSFKEYIRLIENKLTHQKLSTKKEFLAQVKQKEELEKLKKKQEEQKESYDAYLKLSDSEFERRIRRRSREKLKDIKDPEKETKKIEISDEITDKIEKFKSKFNESFKEKYLIQKDEEKDPLELIRERKTKKEKEYKDYKDHFESNKS
ncbi:MAG: hypothetical protein ACXABO_08400 [Promethearchaeota archaeon]|jgi:hypothetical protein